MGKARKETQMIIKFLLFGLVWFAHFYHFFYFLFCSNHTLEYK